MNEKKPHNIPELMGCSENSACREIYRYTCLHYKRRKILYQQPHFTSLELEKEEKIKPPQKSKRKEITKIGAKKWNWIQKNREKQWKQKLGFFLR